MSVEVIEVVTRGIVVMVVKLPSHAGRSRCHDVHDGTNLLPPPFRRHPLDLERFHPSGRPPNQECPRKWIIRVVRYHHEDVLNEPYLLQALLRFVWFRRLERTS